MEKSDGIKAGEKAFGFPLNIKQMGNIDRELKIYVEDYVYTYLWRYAKAKGNSEKLSVLLGRHYSVDGQDTVVVSGAVEAKHTAEENGNEIFTEKSREFVRGQMQKYFPDLSVVGWVRIQPEYGTFMMAKDETYHKNHFRNKWNILMVMDPSEMQDALYAMTESKGSMRRVKGYFIYYDKNEPMQDYMIENSFQPKREEMPEDETAEEMPSGKTAVKRLIGIKRTGKKNEKTPPDRIDAASRIRKVLDEKEKVRKERKNKGYAFTAVCAALSVVCVAMTFAMARERDKIRVLESEILDIKTSYTAMAERFEETVQVFARTENNEKGETKYENESEAKGEKYTIEEGDSLWYICRTFYNGENRIEEIKSINGIENEDILYVGQTILLP